MKHKSSIQKNLSILILLIIFLIPIYIISGLSIKLNQTAVNELIINNLESICSIQKQGIAEFSKLTKESLDRFSYNYDVIELLEKSINPERYNSEKDKARINELIEEQNIALKYIKRHNNAVATLYILNTNFKTILSTEDYEYGSESVLKKMDSIFSSGDFRLGLTYTRSINDSKIKLISIFNGIYKNDKLIGYTIQETPVYYMEGLRTNPMLKNGGSIYLLDKENNIIMAGGDHPYIHHNEMNFNEKSSRSFYENWKSIKWSENTQGHFYTKDNKVPMLTCYSAVPTSDWKILVSVNVDLYMKSNMFIKRAIFGFAIFFSILSFIIAIIYYIVHKRNRKLIEAAHKRIVDANDKMSEALKMAEDANRAKTAFLFNMSHDIRTPMNAIIGYTNMLEKQKDNPEKFHNYLKNIRSASKHLLGIINEVLEMSRIESGKLELNPVEPWSISEFTDNICALFEEDLKKKNLTLSTSIDIKDDYFYCDITKFQDIFINIISNSVKYTDVNGNIILAITQTHRDDGNCELASYKIEVIDNGIGISKDFLPHIFESFSREKTTTASKVFGTGLGMGITKRYVDLMNGKIYIDSEPGKGTATTVELTFKKVKKEKEDIQTLEEENVEERIRGKRILLVEDNNFNAEIAMEILKEFDVDVVRAENGQICIDKINQAPSDYYHLILMDIQMPVMDGYEATKQIRRMADPVKSEIPIIAITANVFSTDKQNAFDAGMNDFIGKPFKISTLEQTLAKWL